MEFKIIESLNEKDTVYVARDVLEKIKLVIKNQSSVRISDDVAISAVQLFVLYSNISYTNPITEKNKEVIDGAIDAICGIYRGTEWT